MDTADIKELEDAIAPVWEIAQGLGLDPYPVHYELVPASIMYEFGSYGLPGRFSHWSHGKMYHRMKTQYDYGLSKIYELVINTNPSYAFLMEGNSVLQNKLVMAHVLGHCDFFKNNAYFGSTNRRMVETASLNAGRIRQYEYEHGLAKVEKFLDAALSIQEHIDPTDARRPEIARKDSPPPQEPVASRTSPYDDLFALTGENKPTERTEPEEKEVAPQPEKDIVGYIMRHSRQLEPWQRDILGIVREEMLYFVPQMQTKIANEGWACATGDSLVLTERGFIRFDQLFQAQASINVSAGGVGETRRVTDYHKEEAVTTIRIRTQRGLTIEGACKHRVLLADGSWAYLSDIQVGDSVAIESGTDVWPEKEQAICFVPAQQSPSVENVAALAGVSSATVTRHMNGRKTWSASQIDDALRTTAYKRSSAGRILGSRNSLHLPATLNSDLAWLLGYFIGDGNRTKSGIGFTTGDIELAEKLIKIIEEVLGLRTNLNWDPTETGGRWRVVVHSRELLDWFSSLGINLRDKAPQKKIPAPILQSPKHVISAFLRGYFDADAYAGKSGVILSSSSKYLINSVQVILLNYGVLSRQRPQVDGCIQLSVQGRSAARFRDEIGFGLSRKRDALANYVDSHLWFKQESSSDPVVSIERGIADVYDITVAEKHSYVANGFVNHNSFWHARIMRELELTNEEYTDFAAMNAGVLAPSRNSINPYYLGVKLLEDIERRWDSPTEEEKRIWGIKGGEGRKKLFEVREEENDVSLIRNYMTEKLVEDLDLYLYERQGDEWVIVDKDWHNVRDNMVARMANFGNPTIVVESGDYRHNGELYLRHHHSGQDLDEAYAEKTLEYVYALWGKPVYLETMLEDERIVYSYTGSHNKELM